MHHSNVFYFFLLTQFASNSLILGQSIPAQDVNCGIQTVKPSIVSIESPLLRIINGQTAVVNSWPWQVSLRRLYSNGSITTHICGGSLLYTNYVITAAHCVDKYTASEVLVMVGVSSLLSVPRSAFIKVSGLKYHAGFSISPAIANDIAVLKLETHVTLGDNIATVCLGESASFIMGKQVVVTGWLV